jgi:hypothetical protein
MKILFVENRYTTFLWDAVAKELSEAGHEIFWIIQNREFVPETGIKFYLNNSTQKIKTDEKVYDTDILKTLRAHRGLRHYQIVSDDHIFSAKNQIEDFVNQIKPDLGFGECTLYQEILTMQALKRREIPFFFPTACRFPPTRFSFYWYDTLIPFGGSKEKMELKEALAMADDIAERRIKPLYLNHYHSTAPSSIDKIKNKIKIFRGYLNGERYNTPGILQKIRLNKQKKRNIKLWERLAGSRSTQAQNKFRILYPLQMQPEATIDVWATNFNNQVDIIKGLLNGTPSNVEIVIKPNPSSSLEITPELITFIKQNKRLRAVSHSEAMDVVLRNIDLVVTATGTIGVECIFANKPVVTLIKSFFNEARNCKYLADYSELSEIVRSVGANKFPKLGDMERAEYLNFLNETSYDGLVSCTFLQRDVLKKQNVSNLVEAFTSIIAGISSKKQLSTIRMHAH